ncbi:hypothetical protein AAFM48_16900 [Burkholderia pseudomallei]
MSQPHHFAYADGHRMVRHTSARGVSSITVTAGMTTAYGASITRGATTACSITALSTISNIGRRGSRTRWATQRSSRPMSAACQWQLTHWAVRGVTAADAQWRTSAATDPAGRITTWSTTRTAICLRKTLPGWEVSCAPSTTRTRSRHA